MWHDRTTDWSSCLDPVGVEVLERLGYSAWSLPDDHNPIVDAVQGGNWGDLTAGIKGLTREAVARMAIVCQMPVYDAQGGPDGDGERKGLRRQWYAWFKVQFSQDAARVFGDEYNADAWNGRMSACFGYLVDKKNVTYHELWVKDASRMMNSTRGRLYRGCHILFAVEKDSLFEDFQAAANAMGAACLVSGKGKMSKAATEKVLQQHFGWEVGYDPFSYDEPLIVLHLSDHDYSGEAVIGPTFGEQLRRYTPHVLEARIGILPTTVPRKEWPARWYEVPVKHSGDVTWANEKSLLDVECVSCGTRVSISGVYDQCPECYQQAAPHIAAEKDGRQVKLYLMPHGFEVEAMPTRTYYEYAVTALLEVLDFYDILEHLRDECKADSWAAAEHITSRLLQFHKGYNALEEEIRRLRDIAANYEDEMRDRLRNLGYPMEGDFRDLEDDPEESEFYEHVESASRHTGPWEPFDPQVRTDALVRRLRAQNRDEIKAWFAQTIDWEK